MKPRFRLKYSDFENSAEGRKTFNEQLFTEVAPKYSLITRLLSFNRDIHWKQRLITLIDPLQVNDCLDLACGDGDIALMLAERFPDAHIIGLDLTEEMLERARQRPGQEKVEWRKGDMCHLELPAESVDVITGGYALRNAPDINRAIIEIHRVLRPGGKAIFLEFAKSDSVTQQHMNHCLLSIWGGLWGLLLHRRSEVYGYIAKSLRHFPPRSELHTIIRSAGLCNVHYETKLFGLMEITKAEKPGTASLE
jgi:demethylmenaquinone methyltransferase/2-methoxy-6-polyprenyl-1,4-benzoquinol methylase